MNWKLFLTLVFAGISCAGAYVTNQNLERVKNFNGSGICIAVEEKGNFYNKVNYLKLDESVDFRFTCKRAITVNSFDTGCTLHQIAELIDPHITGEASINDTE